MLETGWVAEHHREFDLAHLHFGFDAATPAELASWAAELAGRGRPLVLTVHDLINPHFVDQTRHARHLDVLIPAADELITLTAGAAALIEQRWGRRAERHSASACRSACRSCAPRPRVDRGEPW